MKKKIFVIIAIMLLISTVALPVVGTLNPHKNKVGNKNLDSSNDFSEFLESIITMNQVGVSVIEEWNTTYNGPGNQDDDSYDIGVDLIGNVYVTGTSYGGTVTGYDFATIAYYPNNGTTRWINRTGIPYEESSYAMAVDKETGNIYITGQKNSNIYGYNIWTTAFDSSGNTLWLVRWNNHLVNHGDDLARGIVLDSFGNVFVLGVTEGVYPEGDNIVTICYNKSSGIERWNRTYKGSENRRDLPHDITVDSNGNVYVTGESGSSSIISDYVTISYDNDGTKRWNASYHSTSNSKNCAWSIGVDSFIGNVYVAGESEYDWCIVCYYSNNGTERWIKRPGLNPGGSAEWVAIDESNNKVYISGTGFAITNKTRAYDSYGNKLWEIPPGGRITIGDSTRNIYITHVEDGGNYEGINTYGYDSSGNKLWHIVYDCEEINPLYSVKAIAVDSEENIYVTGSLSRASNLPSDYIIIKYSQQQPNTPPEIPTQPVGPIEGKTGNSYSYSTSTSDPDNDNVRYYFDWGDGTGEWTDFIHSGQSTSLSHSWSTVDNYEVKVKAQDEHGAESAWSTSLRVNIQNATITFTFQPGKEGNDSSIHNNSYQERWHWNDGAGPYNGYGQVGTGGEVLRAFIQFDISSIPDNAEVLEATLSLYLINVYNPGTFIYRMKHEWSEGTGINNASGDGVTWFTYDGNNSWPNGQGALGDAEEDPISYINVKLDWTDFPLDTDKVQEWISGDFPNFGMIIITDNEGPNTINEFVSSDNNDSSKRPKLTITVDIPTENNPPAKPSQPSGQINGKVGQEYSYTTSTTDSDGDQVFYFWDWGDGNTSGWLGPHGSGVTAGATYEWAVTGSYNIKVKAKDIYGNESNWSDPLPITMPYSYKPILQFFDWLFERFPTAFPLLRHLLGY